jgi:hypothetical protein
MIASNNPMTEPRGEQGTSPVRSMYILKNGLPVFTKDFVQTPSKENEDNQMLVSGFLTALTSFLKDMKDFGEMRSLVTSSDYRFTFYQVESLLFVACTDGRMNDTMVEKFLRNVSMKFLQAYSAQLANSNMVNMKHYAGFEALIQREMVSRDLRVDPGFAPVAPGTSPTPRLLIPADEARQVFHFNDELHEHLIKYIDGKTDIDNIARLSGMDANRVNSFVRFLYKQGVLQF